MKTRLTGLLTLLIGILTLSGTIALSSAVASDTIRIGFVADALYISNKYFEYEPRLR